MMALLREKKEEEEEGCLGSKFLMVLFFFFFWFWFWFLGKKKYGKFYPEGSPPPIQNARAC